MKLTSPVLSFENKIPYEGDKFNRETFGNDLYELFSKIEGNNVIVLDAKWGEGKSTFIKMWIKHLEKNGKECIYYDAFENDFQDDPFLSFSAEIINLITTKKSTVIKLKEKFKKDAIHVAKCLLTAGVKIGAKTLSAGVIDNTAFETIKDVKNMISDETGDIISKYIKNKLDSYQNEKKGVEKFTKTLQELASEIKEKQGFPLLIIIDELDRCRPDFALKIIERIKHFFSVSNVAFLLVTNIEQLISHVKNIYGISETDAHIYLQKFITSKLSLQNRSHKKITDHFYHRS